MSLNVSSSVSSWPEEALGSVSGSSSRHKPRRRIVPLKETPSMICTDWKDYKIDPERSLMKSSMRVQDYWLKAVIEIVITTPFSRGTTCLQGARAHGKYQAAHFSLMPNTQDQLLDEVVSSLVQNQTVTPKRAGPYLRERANFSSPDFRNLQPILRDQQAVREAIVERLPEKGETSSLAGTVFEKHCNATFDNPDRSNQFDSILEKEIPVFLKELQDRRMAGELDANESTVRLVRWLADFYEESIQSNQIYLGKIDALFSAHSELVAIEESYRSTRNISNREIQSYLKAAEVFLNVQKELNGPPLRGTNRPSGIKKMCPYCQQLKPLVEKNQKLGYCTQEVWIDYFERMEESFSEIDPEEMKSKYHLFVQEAEAQKAGIQNYLAPRGIERLMPLFFGVMRNGKVMDPTEQELRDQVFAMLKPAKEPKKRELVLKENQESSNRGESSLVQPFKRPRRSGGSSK